MRINIQSTAEDQGRWRLIRGLFVVESNYKAKFRKSEEYLIAEDQWQQQQTKDRVGGS